MQRAARLTTVSMSHTMLMYVQSMEIDSLGRMWIIDSGNTPDVTAVPIGMQRTCPPRIVIVDIATTAVVKSHTFDPSVANYSTTFLNDIVLDQTRGLAYISITSGDGGIIVYSLGTNSGRFYSGASTKAQPFATTVVINGLSYNFPFPSDTLALSPDTETLYYGALGGYTMFSLPISVLSNFSASSDAIDAAVQAVFNRSSANGALTQCDGMTTSAQGSFFYGSFGNPFENSIVQRLPNGTVVTLYENVDTMQWVDTLGWAGPGQLVFTTNRLQKYFANPIQLNFSETNFRVLSLAVPGQTSYLQAQSPSPSPPTFGAYAAAFFDDMQSSIVSFDGLKMVGTVFVQRNVTSSDTVVSVFTHPYGDIASPGGLDTGPRTLETSVTNPLCSTAPSCAVTFEFARPDWCSLIGKGATVNISVDGVSRIVKAVFGLGNLSASRCPFATSYNTPPLSAIVKMTPVNDSGVRGSVKFELVNGVLSVSGNISGLKRSGSHGIHVHSFGDVRDVQRALFTGMHFAFPGQVHGLLNNSSRHTGDLGNIVADEGGVAVFKFDVPNDMAPQIALTLLATNGSAVGRSVIVHALPDDGITQPTGNSGSRVAQGVIGYASPPPANPIIVWSASYVPSSYTISAAVRSCRTPSNTTLFSSF